MNNAGLPGTGLGGLFYILLAIAMPLLEIVQTMRGRSSRARWRRVAEQFAVAVTIVAATVASTSGYLHLAGAPTLVALTGPALVVAPALAGLVVLAALLAAIRAWAWLRLPAETLRGRHRRKRRLPVLTRRSTS